MNSNKTISELIDFSGMLRGRIINNAIFLERTIDEFLSSYFCDSESRKTDLMEMVISEHLTFDIKRQTLEFILKRTNPNFLVTYPDFLSRVEKLMKHRNVFAHWMLDTSDEGLKYYQRSIVSFIRFKVKTSQPNRKEYSQEVIDSAFGDFDYCIKAMSTIMVATNPSDLGSGATSKPSTEL